MRRLAVLGGFGMALLGALTAGAFAAAAQEATGQANQKPQTASPPAQQQQPAWASSCSSQNRTQPLECAMEQRAIVSQTGQVVALVTIRVPSDTKKPVAMVQLPLGLFLPAGINVDVDGDMMQNQAFQTCNNGGCFVGFPISDALLKQMFNGGKFNITFQYLDKKPVTLPMSLSGFTETYNKIK